MSAGKSVRLILLKDLRRSAWPLILIVALGFVIALSLHMDEPSIPVVTKPISITEVTKRALPNTPSYAVIATLIYCGAFLLTAYLTIEIVATDSPARELGFLSTRPVKPAAVFYAKLVFIGFLVIVSGWGFAEVDYVATGMRLRWLDHVCLLVETTARLGAQIAFFVLFALFIRSKPRIFLATASFLVGAIVFLVIVVAFFPPPAVFRFSYNRLQSNWNGLVIFFGELGFVGLMLLVGWMRYRRHQVLFPLVLLAAGIMMILLACAWAQHLGYDRLADREDVKLPASLNIRLGPIDPVPTSQEQESFWNGVIFRTVVRGVSVEGLQAPYFVESLGSESSATLRSGRVIKSIEDQGLPSFPRGEPSTPLEAAVIGVNAAVPGVSFASPGITLRAFTYCSSRLPAGEDLTGATLKGQVRLQIRRAFIAGSMPIQTGAVFNRPRQLYEITATSSSLEGISVNVKHVEVPLLLRGDSGGSAEDLSLVAVSPVQHQMLSERSGSSSGIPFPIFFLSSSMLFSQPGENALAPDWIRGAEIVFIGSSSCGEVTLPYEINNVTLTR